MSRCVPLLLLAIALTTAPTHAANLLANPGFESQSGGWPTGYGGWGHMQSVTGSSVSLAPHGGDRVLMGSGVYNDAYHAGGVYQFVPAAAGETFRTQAWIYHHAAYSLTSGCSLWIKLEFKNAAGTLLASQSLQVGGPSTTKNVWRLVAGPQATAPTGTATAGIVLVFMQNNASDSGAGFWDDAVLERVVAEPIAYDLADRGATFAGFGAQLWGYYYNPSQQYDALGALHIRYIRLERESASWAQMQATRVSTNALGIKWIYMIWRAPSQFMDAQNRLLDSQLSAFAQWWATQVSDLYLHNIPIEYIELMNEPDSNGQWSTGITATQYNTLVKQVRTALDAYDGSGGTPDLRGVRIVGPGTSNLNNATNYLNALDADAVAAHDVWSAHAWGTYDSCGPACIQYAWPSYGEAATARNPNLAQFVTEYATSQRTYFGVTYPNADAYGGWDANDVFPYYSVTNTMPFAVRVYGNTLGLLNNGANAPFIWQLLDFPSAVQQVGKAWGLLDLWGQPKPVYGALQTLYPEIPVGARVLNAQGSNPHVYTGAYLLGNRLVIGLANETASAQNATVQLTGVTCAEVLRATAFVQTYAGDPAIGEPDVGQAQPRTVAFEASHSLTVTLPAVSTLTVVCSVAPGLGDLDGSGAVDAGDLAALDACWVGAGGALASGCHCLDADADGDVDLLDAAALQREVAP
jgi:hypothetical protein